ncbi:MAG TPA: acyl-CoA dehydratase activase [Clostridia bacterium]|nr:acyl-CoA dehydratase activase [Clostridia bacterium]
MYTFGIDIGSTSSKAVILQDGKDLVAHVVVPLGTGTVGPREARQKVFEASGLTPQDIGYTIVTGYGRMNCDYANDQISELSCHAKGIHYLLPTADTIIDIGGQDAKAIKINPKGQMLAFQMNDKCAAGTGRFLDVMARVLNVDINNLGPVSEKSTNPVAISNTCTVFAESEVISQLSSNIPIEDIAAGIHNSVAKRVAGMALRLGRSQNVAMSGGVALNIGVVHAMSRELDCPVLVHPLCQSAGAIGAAVLAWEKYLKREGQVS